MSDNKRWTETEAMTRIGQARLGCLTDEKMSIEYLKAMRSGLQDWLRAIDSEIESNSVACQLCGKEILFDEAIEDGWAPSVWTKNGLEILEPTCPTCIEDHYALNEDGEWICKD
jgi:hypothetical protein